MPRSPLVVGLIALLAHAGPGRAAAQATRADSAAIVHSAGQRLSAEGRREAAQAVFRYVVRTFPGTEAAERAALDLAASTRRSGERDGRVELVAWTTLYGAWLGVAVPAMLDADGPEPYGVGLLLGGPAGFYGGTKLADAARPTLGQARATTFAFRWGSWQAFGWREVFDIGEPEPVCGEWGCYTQEESRAPWTAMVVGGLASMTATALAVGGRDLPAGAVSFASHGAYWGTFFGGMLAAITDREDDDALTYLLAGGDIGLVAGALAAPRDVSSSRVRVTTAVGIAGMVAGWGVDLLVQPNEEEVALTIPTVGAALGLAAGWQLTRKIDDTADPGNPGGAGQTALLDLGRGGARLGMPSPVPMRQAVGARGPRTIYRPAVGITLLSASF